MKNIEQTIKLLDHIKQNPKATQRELVEELDISLGKVNFLIKSLAKTGMIKLERFKKSNNKKGYLYVLTPKGMAEKAAITRHFLEEKTEEYNRLKSQIAELKALVEEVEHANGRY